VSMRIYFAFLIFEVVEGRKIWREKRRREDFSGEQEKWWLSSWNEQVMTVGERNW
jgi:hypothetical protein